MSEVSNSTIVVTIDVDWACETALESTLDFFQKKNIPITLFSTHDSAVIRERIKDIDVGLHPYFHQNSDHGGSVQQTIETISAFPHNIPAYRSHRFITSNEIEESMKNAGMVCSSNVCGNLEILPVFYTRINLLEIPIFMEDGGYLYNSHPLFLHPSFIDKISQPGVKVIVIHPMHFSVNTPNWNYMVRIKKSMSRIQWRNLSTPNLADLNFPGRGIRHFIEDFIEGCLTCGLQFESFGNIIKQNQTKARLH